MTCAMKSLTSYLQNHSLLSTKRRQYNPVAERNLGQSFLLTLFKLGLGIFHVLTSKFIGQSSLKDTYDDRQCLMIYLLSQSPQPLQTNKCDIMLP